MENNLNKPITKVNIQINEHIRSDEMYHDDGWTEEAMEYFSQFRNAEEMNIFEITNQTERSNNELSKS